MDNERGEINPIFFSTETGKPFTNCKVCDRFLLEEGTEYLVEKAFRKYKGYKAEDVIFEFAICMQCHQETYNQISVASKNAMQKYMAEHIDFNERLFKNMQADADPEWWKQSCAVTGDNLENLEEYQLVASFNGKATIKGHLPMLVGGKAIDELADLLSNETLDFLDGFNDKIIGPPPELEDLLKPKRRPILI